MSIRVHAANVHMLMEGYDNSAFQKVINTADLVLPDGVPLVWALKLLGHKEAARVYGPTLTLHVCEAAAREGVAIGLYGGTPESLLDFKAFLHHEYPGIQIACAIAPPFRALTQEEDDAYTQEILDSGARILFVGIGCPKQEWWMYNHRDRLPLVMLGVGAAFDFHSGRVKQSPAVLQRLGLEWLFRLVMEPKRLWKRYAKHNPRFVALFARQLFKEKVLGRKGAAQ
ncbi:glycosyltransferase [Deinococcus sp. LM3]|nr:glycosyltransferase [Deinococcus sp. LM3]